MTDELPDLTDLTVQEQKDELENLSKKELKDLREKEERQTAIDNIHRELSSRQGQEEDTQDEPQPEPAQDEQEEVIGNSEQKEYRSEDNKVAELERKVDYLIERCKTTSHEGFKGYDN